VEAVEPGVRAVAQDQFVVGAHLHDPAALQHHDPGGVADGEQVVRDDDGGPAGHQAAQRGHDALPGAGVEAGGGLVQEEHGGVPDHGAGDRQALALPAGQRPAALADHRVVPVRQQPDERVGVRLAGRRHDLGVGGVGPAVGDVLPHRAVEHQRLLQDHGHAVADVGQGQGPQIVPVEAHGAPVGVVEAQVQLGHRGLSGAAGADQGQRLAGQDTRSNSTSPRARRRRLAPAASATWGRWSRSSAIRSAEAEAA
jgi:hypothetical protein